MLFKSVLPILSSCLLVTSAYARSTNGCEILSRKLSSADECTSNSKGEITNLFLSGDNITSDFFKNVSLTSLEELTINNCNNSYEFIKNNIKNLSSLKTLEMNEDANDLEVSTDFSFFKNSKLTKLSFNVRENGVPSAGWVIRFKLPKTIKELDFSGFTIYQSDVDYISKFKTIEKLWLKLDSSEKIDYSKLKNLSNLKEIDIDIVDQNEKESGIPEFYFALTKLEKLYLGDKGIRTVSSKIGNLKNLKVLELQNNKITKLPSTIGNLKNLQKLQLYKNRLSSLPDEFRNLVRLEDLSLAQNKFTKFPKSFENLTSLNTLDMSDNLIDDELPQYFNQFSNLEYIYLSSNKNIKGKFLTNDHLVFCAFDSSPNYDLCIVKDITCLKHYNYPFKHCGDDNVETPENPISIDGKCGPENGHAVCPNGLCCSQYGYCGSTSDYCSEGCQSEFGRCN